MHFGKENTKTEDNNEAFNEQHKFEKNKFKGGDKGEPIAGMIVSQNGDYTSKFNETNEPTWTCTPGSKFKLPTSNAFSIYSGQGIKILAIELVPERPETALGYEATVGTQCSLDIKDKLGTDFDFVIGISDITNHTEVSELIQRLNDNKIELGDMRTAQSNTSSFAVHGQQMSKNTKSITGRIGGVNSTTTITNINVFANIDEYDDEEVKVAVLHAVPTDTDNGLYNAIAAVATIGSRAVTLCNPMESAAIGEVDQSVYSGAILFSASKTPLLLGKSDEHNNLFSGITYWPIGHYNYNGKKIPLEKITPQMLGELQFDYLKTRSINLLRGNQRRNQDGKLIPLMVEMLSIFAELGNCTITDINIVASIKASVLDEFDMAEIEGMELENNSSIYELSKKRKGRKIIKSSKRKLKYV